MKVEKVPLLLAGTSTSVLTLPARVPGLGGVVCPQLPRLSFTVTHLQRSHKVKHYISQSDLDAADGRFVWSCGPQPPTINLLCMMSCFKSSPTKLHLQRWRPCLKNSWNSREGERGLSVNLFFRFQIFDNESDMQQQQQPGGNQWGYPPLLLCQTHEAYSVQYSCSTGCDLFHKIGMNQDICKWKNG